MGQEGKSFKEGLCEYIKSVPDGAGKWKLAAGRRVFEELRSFGQMGWASVGCFSRQVSSSVGHILTFLELGLSVGKL